MPFPPFIDYLKFIFGGIFMLLQKMYLPGKDQTTFVPKRKCEEKKNLNGKLSKFILCINNGVFL